MHKMVALPNTEHHYEKQEHIWVHIFWSRGWQTIFEVHIIDTS